MISEAMVGAFLSTYISSFDDLSGTAMAAHYHQPSVMTRADGSVYCFASVESTRSILAELVKAYFHQGARQWQYEDLTVVPIGRRGALASVNWLMANENGALLKRWRHSYTLVESSAGLQILAAIYNAP